MKPPKTTHVMDVIFLLVMFFAFIYAISDKPAEDVQVFVQHLLEVSIAPYTN